jgi:hypothetical protein
MKNLILAALIAGASVSSVSAMTTTGQLSEVNRIEAQRYVPNGDFSNLSSAQVTAIDLLFMNSDDVSAGENPAGKIKKILERS